MLNFWQLPGPKRWLRAIAEDLAQGRCVSLAMPVRQPEGWLNALQIELRDRASLEIERVTADGAAPLTQLIERFGTQDCAHFGALMDSPSLAGQCLAVLEVSTEQWPAWKALLQDFEAAVRDRRLFERPRLLIDGGVASLRQPPKPQPGLIFHRWNDAVTLLDQRIYSALLFDDFSGPPWRRHLAAAITCELALWDPEISEFFRRLGFDQLLDPLEPLKSWASEHHWHLKKAKYSEEEAWYLGFHHWCEGRFQEHAGWLAIHDDKAALNQRIWNAQVVILFPLLERHRQALIKHWSHRLTIPYSSPSGDRITDRRDLELSHIAAQWRDAPDLRRERNFVIWLRDMRNLLAHGEAVPITHLQVTLWQERFGQPELLGK